MKSLVPALKKIVGPDRIAEDLTHRNLYGRDMMTGSTLELKAGHPPHLPDLICWPKSVLEIAKILRLANQFKIPVIPFGAGSGVSGGTLPLQGGIMLDLKKMNRLEKISGGEAIAQCGILGEHLEQQLNDQGWTLGHFPSSIFCATLGGYLAARSAGQLSSRYGKIEEMVTDVEAVLPTGEIVPFGGAIRPFPKIHPKDLLVGSEGTLGVITRAKLKIAPLPPAARYRGVTFNRVEGGLAAIRTIMQSDLRPSVIRLYDPLDSLLLQLGYESEDRKKSSPQLLRKLKQRALQLLLHAPEIPQMIFDHLPTDCLLILGFEGEAELIAEQEKAALAICRRGIARDLGAGPGLHWLKHRYSVSFKMPQLFAQGFFVDTIEVASTWIHLPQLYHQVKRALQRDCLVLAHFSHAYPEGCSIYFTVVGRTGSEEKDCVAYRKIWREAMEQCLEVGGTISHHHGIGILKAEWLPQELGGAMAFFKEMKRKLDPAGIMNPGKMGL